MVHSHSPGWSSQGLVVQLPGSGPNNSFKPKTNRCAIVFGLIQALGRMNQSRKRLKLAIWLGIAAVLAFPLWFVGYNVWYEVIAHRQYRQCKELALPTNLAVLENEFGHPVFSQKLQDGTLVTYFEPSPLYVRAWSTAITARSQPPSSAVVDLSCGEGW